MTGAGLSHGIQFPATSPAKPQKNTWFIITSEEIKTIRQYLSDIEPDAPEYSRERTREISRIMDIIEKRLV